MRTNTFKFYYIVLAFIVIFSSCQDGADEQTFTSFQYSSKLVDEWVKTSIEMVKTSPGFSPPVAARTYAYMSFAMYEALRPGMPGYQSLAGQITGYTTDMVPIVEDKPYLWDVVANKAVFEVLKACFSGASIENEPKLLAKYESLLATITVGDLQAHIDNSLELGEKFGEAMVNYAAGDKQIECYKSNFPGSFVSPTGVGLWVPTSAQVIPLQPYWGEVRSFSLGGPGVTVAAPLAYSEDPSSEFYKEAHEVYIQFKTINNKERVIAEYWSDDPGKTGTPPGHSMSIARQVILKEKLNLGLASVAMAKVGMGVHDAFVNCWKSKYLYNLIRPITYIKKVIDPNFTSILPTPPFPEYTSGHSVQSGAAATILEGIFGANYAFEDRTHVDRTDINGAPRYFFSFKEFADEAAISRLYGGIHYRRAIDLGVEQGNSIGHEILKIQFTK